MQEDKDLSEKYQRRILTKYEYEHYFLKGKPLPPKSKRDYKGSKHLRIFKKAEKRLLYSSIIFLISFILALLAFNVWDLELGAIFWFFIAFIAGVFWLIMLISFVFSFISKK
ncbi:MAG: hypothetical protein ACTSSG_12125 [Candidatus Heimdallarchaeaceae archaeon]